MSQNEWQENTHTHNQVYLCIPSIKHTRLKYRRIYMYSSKSFYQRYLVSSNTYKYGPWFSYYVVSLILDIVVRIQVGVRRSILLFYDHSKRCQKGDAYSVYPGIFTRWMFGLWFSLTVHGLQIGAPSTQWGIRFGR